MDNEVVAEDYSERATNSFEAAVRLLQLGEINLSCPVLERRGPETNSEGTVQIFRT